MKKQYTIIACIVFLSLGILPTSHCFIPIPFQTTPKELVTKLAPSAYALLWLKVITHELGHLAALKLLTSKSTYHVSLGGAFEDDGTCLYKGENLSVKGLLPTEGNTTYQLLQNEKNKKLKRILITLAGPLAGIITLWAILFVLATKNRSGHTLSRFQQFKADARNACNPLESLIKNTTCSSLTRFIAFLCTAGIFDEVIDGLLPREKGCDGYKLWTLLGAGKRLREVGHLGARLAWWTALVVLFYHSFPES